MPFIPSPSSVPISDLKNSIRMVSFRAPVNQGMTRNSSHPQQPTRKRQDFTYLKM